jgi:hypothetical protein
MSQWFCAIHFSHRTRSRPTIPVCDCSGPKFSDEALLVTTASRTCPVEVSISNASQRASLLSQSSYLFDKGRSPDAQHDCGLSLVVTGAAHRRFDERPLESPDSHT